MRTLRGFIGIATAPSLRWMNSIAGGQVTYISSSFREEKPRCAERNNSFQFRKRRKLAWLLIQAGSHPRRFAFDWQRDTAAATPRASFTSSIFPIQMPRRFSLENNAVDSWLSPLANDDGNFVLVVPSACGAKSELYFFVRAHTLFFRKTDRAVMRRTVGS